MIDERTRSFWSGAFWYRTLAGIAFAKMHRAVIEQASAVHPASLLDIACGDGTFLARFHTLAPQVRIAGSDIAPGMLTRARHNLPPSVQLVETGAETQPFPDASFDVVTTLMAFHHFGEPDRVLEEVHRLLVAGGTYLIADVVAPSDSAKRWWNTTERLTGIRGHVGHYTDADMRVWAERNRFQYASARISHMAKRYRIMTLTKI